MSKLRHIALAAEDRFAAAEFYKQAFDFSEVSRIDKSEDPNKSYGVFLSDMHPSLAVLHFGWDQGPGLDFRGIHHFGVLVEDVDEVAGKIENSALSVLPSGRRGTRVFTKPNSTVRTR